MGIDGSLDQGDGSQDGKTCKDSGFILEVKATGLSIRLDVVVKRKCPE